MANALKVLAVACGALVAGAAVRAQTLSDPTRPPPGAYASGAPAAEQPGAPVLQSVMITPHQKAAIISGVMVRQGEKFGSAQVVRISETEVVLQEGKESQVLKLYPGIDKHSPGSVSAASPGAGGLPADGSGGSKR